MRLRHTFIAISAGLITLAWGLSLSGQEKTDPPVEKAPAEKEPVGEASKPIPKGFRLYVLSDGRFSPEDTANREGNLHDPVSEHGLGPVLAVFVKKIPTNENDPLFAVLKMQQDLAAKYRRQRLGAFFAMLVFQDDFPSDPTREDIIIEAGKAIELYPAQDAPKEAPKEEAKESAAPKSSEPKKAMSKCGARFVTIGVAEAKVSTGAADAKKTAPQVEAWGIGDDDAITVVLYNRLKELKRWSFKADQPPTEKDLATIKQAVDALMKK